MKKQVHDSLLEFSWQIGSGYYENEEALAEYLSSEFSVKLQRIYTGNFDKPIFTYDRVKKKMNFQFKGRYRHPIEHAINPPRIVDILMSRPSGFSDAFRRKFKFVGGGTFELDPHNLMYVYSDIVAPYSVGDVQTPLLRVVALKGERNQTVNETFNNLYYLPVARRGFDTIEININTERGEPMPFSGGKSLAVLHFKSRNESVLPHSAFG